MAPRINRIRISLPGQGYDAVISAGLLLRAGDYLRGLFGNDKKVFVITVPPVRRRWGKKLMDSLAAANIPGKMLEMPDGERHKRLTTVEQLAEKLTTLGADRNAIIIALGGGVVGDVAGMVASLYMRGVGVVQIPTTVLAQVDASIGGKTGVNLRTGKNLLGTFHQPLAVLIDPLVLSTLPEREFRAGLYESLKCGVIGDSELFHCMESISVKNLRRDPVTLEWIITRSVKLKAEIVSADEREGGLRRVLNFGHTIGHALETESNYRRFLHGEAVAWGMIAATDIAVASGYLGQPIGKRVARAISSLGPLPGVKAHGSKILALLQTDKKTAEGKVHFVLPTKIGEVRIVNDVAESIIARAVDNLKGGQTTTSERRPNSSDS